MSCAEITGDKQTFSVPIGHSDIWTISPSPTNQEFRQTEHAVALR
jgi:hypothetical protein